MRRSPAAWPCIIMPRSAAIRSGRNQPRAARRAAVHARATGMPARPRCINVVALKRNEFLPRNDPLPGRSPSAALSGQGRAWIMPAKFSASNDQLLPHVNALLNFIQEQQEGKHGRARERRRAA